MRELEAILAAYEAEKAQGRPCVLATVVHVEGSSYRQAGARMLVTEEGRMTGSISGGCLEGDALRKALLALHSRQNKLVGYDTNDEDDAVVGAQLGCNGVIQVLFEPVWPEQSDNPLELLRPLTQQADAMAVVVVFDLQKNNPQAGTCCLFDHQLQVYGTPPDDRFRSALRADVQGVFERGQSFFGVYQMGRSRQEVFIEWYPPPPCLVLVGAGNDAQITAQMATLLGWKVVVADGRPTHANRQRFGGECQVIVARPEKVLENIHVGPQTAFVLMTHNFPYDLAVFRLLCQLPETPYIGLLGPQKRFQKMLDAYAPPPHILQKVFAPVGLHLGAENAAEIALSILAEILAVMRKTGGGHLRAKSGPIHDRAGLDFQVKQI